MTMLCIPLSSQLGALGVQYLDSLETIIYNNNSDDSLKYQAYLKTIEYHASQNNENEENRTLDALEEFIESKGSDALLLKFWTFLSNREYARGNFNQALDISERTLQLSIELEANDYEAELSSILGMLYSIKGRYDEARTISNKAKKQSIDLGDERLITKSLTALGNTEQRSGNFEKAISYYFEIDSIFQNSSYYNSNDHAKILINMGLIYASVLEDPEKGKEYLNSVLHLTPPIPEALYFATLGRIGNIWLKEEEYHTADSLLEIAINGLESHHNSRDLVVSTMYLGKSKILQGVDNYGLQLLQKAKSKFDELSDRSGQRLVNRQLANYYQDKKQYEKSEHHLSQVLQYSYSPSQRVAVLKQIAHVAARQGKFETAYDSLLSHTQLLDSLYEMEYQVGLTELENQYQTAQKEKEIIQLKLNQTLYESRNQKLISWGFIIGFLLLASASFYYYRSRQKTILNQHLKDLDNLKSKLFADISHEFRTPLSLISGPVELISQKVNDISIIQQELDIVRNNTKKLNHLVDSVQHLSKLDAGKMELHITVYSLPKHLNTICASFESLAQSKSLPFYVELDLPDREYCYAPDHIETIIYNLLSNAIKFTITGEIRLKASYTNGITQISVSDTGIGLSEHEKDKIFDRYHRVENNVRSIEGIGIGLALTNELVKLHLGKIEVQSTPDIGSIFTIQIPTDRAFYISKGHEVDSSSTIQQNLFPPIVSETIHTEKVGNKEQPVILIIEDNIEMREHIKSLFVEDYHILKSANGKEGFAQAVAEIPDIIISDLMMPIMDGISLLKAIKSDIRTSHIPFLMLTANHNEQEKLKGLELRADDFLTKPFSIEEVRLKVKNHILLREQLKVKYLNSESEGISTAEPINETEDRFWKNLNEVTMQNLSDASFTTDDFAKAMHMSRMQLHRKLTSLTDLSASRFIRNERLKRGHRILLTETKSISEVAYEVGFTSPSFFTHCFKEKYGVTPSALTKQNK